MSKCPICGSDGDDLVFKFYCSNAACDNHVTGGGRKNVGKLETVDDKELERLKSVRNRVVDLKPAAWNVRKLSVIDRFPASRDDDDFRREYLSEWPPPMPRDTYAFYNECLRLPKFEVRRWPGGRIYVTWHEEEVPQILRQIANHVVEYTHTSGNKKDAARRLVKDHLTRLVLNGELVWSNELERWELHSVEY